MNSSNYTGRTARTLVDAFGPYATWNIERKPSFAERYAIALALVLFFTTIGVSLVIQLKGF